MHNTGQRHNTGHRQEETTTKVLCEGPENNKEGGKLLLNAILEIFSSTHTSTQLLEENITARHTLEVK